MGTSSGAYELNHECASVNSFITYTREVNVTTIIYRRIKDGSFPFSCTGYISNCITLLLATL